MENLSTEEILTLVNLTLIEGEEGIHYHWDPVNEFYNQCHSPEDGKFCSDPAISGKVEIRDSDGVPTKVEISQVKRGKLGASLVDPHEGTQTFDGVRGYDKNGKPVPGTDAYLEAHNITREAWNARPYVKFEASKTDAALIAAFPKDKYPEGHRLFLGTAEDTDPPQSGGYIMYKHPVPGSPQGEIAPQIRPNAPVVTDKGERAKHLTILKNSQEEYETLKKTSPETFLKKRRAELIQAQKNLERIKKATPESIKAEERERLVEAKIKRDNIIANTDDPLIKKAAQKEYNGDKRKHDKIVGTPSKPGAADRPSFKEGEIENRTLRLEGAEKKLAKAIADPKSELEIEIKKWGGEDGTGGYISKNQKRYDETAAKYLFTPGVTSARIDCSQDPQNIKNLVKGKGRIYFAMEGSIKNDAILTAIKKEDPTAAIINVPSVTLWQQKNLDIDVPQEIGWFANKYAKGRDVILIPDADGITNKAVMLQAKALKSALEQNGAGQVYLATPPLKPKTKYKLDPFNLPSGAPELRKGIDDHLGAGRGTLGQLRYETFIERPDYDLSHHTVAKGAKGQEKISAGAIPRAERILGAISGLVEDKGIGVIPLKTLNQTAGFRPSQRTSARSARDVLERAGIIKVEWLFDRKALGRGQRIRNPKMSDEREDELVRMKVIDRPNPYKQYTEVSIEESPIISIIKPQYIIRADKKHVGTISELPNWKPPASYKSWTSAVTEKPDTTGIAKTQVDNHIEFIKTKAVRNNITTVKPGQTTKQRLAKKKAPPGRRLVRSEAGAKRYGVSIGQPIPLQGEQIVSMTMLDHEMDSEIVSMTMLDLALELNLTSMVLLSPLVSEDELVAFYNKCHDEGGRFCETDGGPVSGKFGNIQTVGRAVVGSVEVDGIKAKAVYEISTTDGQVIRLYDKVGNASRYKDELLESQAQMHNLYPMRPPRNIIVTKPDSLFRDTEIDEGTFAIVHGNKPYTYINSDMLGVDVGKYKDGFQMPSAKTGDTNNMDYLVTHEYGHHLDFDRHSNGGYSYQSHPMYKNPAFKSSLSTYGQSDPNGVEAYAETFAEWHHSGGQTTNPATVAMARYEGWAGVNELRASAYDSHTPISMVLQNPVHFADNSVKEFPDDTEDDINADVPKLSDKGISVIDSLTGPKIIGDFEVKKPSSKEIARADKILREVYAELKLEYPAQGA